MLTVSRIRAIILSIGIYGPKNERLRLKPNIPNGNKKHTGQSRPIAPIAPARPVARLVPTGHIPFLLFHIINPEFKEINIIRINVKINSVL